MENTDLKSQMKCHHGLVKSNISQIAQTHKKRNRIPGRGHSIIIIIIITAAMIAATINDGNSHDENDDDSFAMHRQQLGANKRPHMLFFPLNTTVD